MLSALSFAVNLVFPKRCLVCGAADAWLCEACVADVADPQPRCLVCGRASVDGATHPHCRTSHTADGVLAAAPYRQLQPILHAYKFSLVRELAEPLSAVMANFLAAHRLERFVAEAMLVPVPLHASRKRYRGFNQALLLAEHLATRLTMPAPQALLARARPTEAQSQLPRDLRLQNLKGAFQLAPGADVRGRKILLIDDIATTGATINECATVLKRAGAVQVWAFVVAHG